MRHFSVFYKCRSFEGELSLSVETIPSRSELRRKILKVIDLHEVWLPDVQITGLYEFKSKEDRDAWIS